MPVSPIGKTVKKPKGMWLAIVGHTTLLCSVVLVWLSSSCSEKSAEDKGSFSQRLVDVNGCNPLASEGDCLLPYPSDVFLVDDAEMPTGKRVDITGDAVMVTIVGKKIQPMKIYKADGFSQNAQIAVLFPEEVDDTSLVFHTDDVAASLQDESPTVILEADSLERVVHFAELDPNAESDARRTMLIRPLVQLKEKTRYIVVVRNLHNTAGKLLAAPKGFQKIRDRESIDDEILTALQNVYENKIFPVLEAAGISRGETLQLAWDFTTGSLENTTGDMMTVRADVIERLTENPPSATVTGVTENADHKGSRLVRGTITVPLYVESEAVGAKLHRNSDGKVVVKGETDVPWSALIPASVLNRAPGAAPVRAIQYGHSAFSSQWELLDTMIPIAAAHLESVFFAVDWWGFALPDQAYVTEAVSTNPSEVFSVGDRLHQAIANQIALSYAIGETLITAEELFVGESLVYDPAQVYFYGNSGGAIMGATYTALAPNVERSVLGVGGVNFPLIMYRSLNFAAFHGLLQILLKDPVDIQKFLLVFQTVIDRFDPATYAPHMIRDTYPNSPPSRKVLLQIGLGDPRVCTLSGELLARYAGVKLLEPVVRPVYGLSTVQAPYDGSAMTVFDFNVVPEPTQAEIPKWDNVVHNGIRLLPAANNQIDAFFRPGGRIESTCDGICDPE